MTLNGWFQIALFSAIVVVATRRVGGYMTRLFSGERTLLSPVLRPLEIGFYRLAGVDERAEQHWLGFTVAMLVFRGRRFEKINALELQVGDVALVEAGDTVPGDGEVVEGIASVNESAITGESAPVIRESGGDRSAVTGGTLVLSDWIKARVTAGRGSSFLDRMIALIDGAERQKTPNEIALNILLAGMTLIFIMATVSIPGFVAYAGGAVPVVVLVALFVTLIPTTIGALLSAIGIAGMDRLVRFNVLAMSGRAVEAAGDVDTLLLDKTGTITLGNREATAFIPVYGTSEHDLAEAAFSPRWPTKPPKAARS